jgi:hypothetical protein
MKIVWKRDEGKAEVSGIVFDITCNVRNEIDPDFIRKMHDPAEVVQSVVNGQWGPPYMPRKFPKGTWRITNITESDAPDFAPIKIHTDARQKVQVWGLDSEGGYDHPTGEYVEDSGYLLHWSQFSKTTRGCGRVGTDTKKQVEKLAKMLRAAIAARDLPLLEVV